jgi:hypothetical protein
MTEHERRKALGFWGDCQIENGAVTSAAPVHLRVEPAHFDWRWREPPVLALLAWEGLARDPLATATPHPSGVNWNDN